MLYAILGHEAPDGTPKRPGARPEHLAHVQALQEAGRLVLAGPRPRVDARDPGAAGYHGSLVVAEFPDLASAKQWAESDPYRVAGVFDRVDVYPFVQVFPGA